MSPHDLKWVRAMIIVSVVGVLLFGGLLAVALTCC